MQPQATLRASSSTSLNALRMLQAPRVDFWFVNEISAERLIRAEGGTPVRQQLALGRVDAYIACHIATPPEPVEKLHQGILKLRRQGELAEFGLR